MSTVEIKRTGMCTWSIIVPPQLLTQSDGQQILNIPGLRFGLADYTSGASIVYGDIDAVAAACRRLGITATLELDDELEVIAPELYSFQRKGVASCLADLRRTGGHLLADDMGLGKTKQAIEVIKILDVPTLVVCPANVRRMWEEEVDKIACAQPIQKRLVCSYNQADKLTNSLPWTPELVVMDEAHYLCGRKSQRSQTLDEIASSARYKLALTGTPLSDRPRDLYKLLKILFGAHRWGSPSEFDITYCAARQNQYGGLDNRGASNADELKYRLSFYQTRRTKAEVAKQLPKLSRQPIWLDANESATRAYEVWLANRHGSFAQKALESCLAHMIPAVVEHAVQAKRFLVTTWMRTHAIQIASKISKETKLEIPVLLGGQSEKQRRILLAYAKEHGTGIVATMDSIGVGFDGLQHIASTGICHALSPKHALMLQVEARLDRIGQNEPVTWYYYALRDSMSEHVLRLILPKMRAAQQLQPHEQAKQLEEALASQPEEDLQELYNSLPDTVEEDLFNGIEF